MSPLMTLLAPTAWLCAWIYIPSGSDDSSDEKPTWKQLNENLCMWQRFCHMQRHVAVAPETEAVDACCRWRAATNNTCITQAPIKRRPDWKSATVLKWSQPAVQLYQCRCNSALGKLNKLLTALHHLLHQDAARLAGIRCNINVDPPRRVRNI